MANTYESGFSTTLAAKLESGDTTMEVATAPTKTKGRLFLQSGNKKEWIEYDGVSGTTLQNLTRDLSTTADPATSGTGKVWVAGTPVSIVAMHDQLADRQEDNTFQGDILFNNVKVGGVNCQQMTTTERNNITNKRDGQIIYNTSTGTLQKREGGSWIDIASGSTPNSDTTTAGKVETGTSSESVNGTDVGGTGANLFVLPSDIAKNQQTATFMYGEANNGTDDYTVDLTPAISGYTKGQKIRFLPDVNNTGACTLNVNSNGAKSIKTREGNDPANGDINTNEIIEVIYDGTNFILQNDIAASTSEQGLAELATDSEADSRTAGVVVDASQVIRAVNKGSFDRVIEHPFMGDGSSVVGGNGNNVQVDGGPSRARIQASGGSGAYRIINEITNKVGNSNDFARYDEISSIEMLFTCTAGGSSDQQLIGFGELSQDFDTQSTTNNKAIVEYRNNTTIRFRTADGSTENVGSDVSITDAVHDVRLVLEPGNKFEIYIDGSLQDTSSSNLPSGTNTIQFGVGATGGAPEYRGGEFTLKINFT